MEYARGAIKNKAGYKATDASGSVTSLIPAARLCACVCVCVYMCVRVFVSACVRVRACVCMFCHSSSLRLF